jgi:ribonuclease HII
MLSTTSIGRDAEDVVAKSLAGSGHSILAKNWRTRWCEIDIVSKYNDTVYFTEVKYRSNSNQGTGVEYVTKAKQRQMRFASEFWLSNNNWDGNAEIQVASIDADQNIEIYEA